MRNGRKGISELVAAMMLISITVAAAFVLYVYSSGLLGSLQGAQPQQPYADQIVLEYYDWSSNPGNTNCYDSALHTICVTFRNVGSGLGTLADFFIYNSTFSTALSLSGGNCTTVTGTFTTPVTTYTTAATITTSSATLRPLKPQNFCTTTLKIPPSVTITKFSTYAVKIVTRGGAVFSYNCIAGKATGGI